MTHFLIIWEIIFSKINKNQKDLNFDI